MDIIDEINGKRILIWGYGREGKSTERFLKRCCKPASVAVYEGGREGICEADYDYIIKSPGIVMREDHPKYTSQTELFLKQFRRNVIGITGTKGKSTTSSMLYHVLRECADRPVFLVGNIGQPCLDDFEEISGDTIVVYEMSCHQLAHTRVSPHIAVFLNLFEEHLDYYGTMERYFEAKSHIAAYQEADDIFFAGENVPGISTAAKTVVIKKEEGEPYALKLAGAHNQYNAQFVYRIAVEVFHCGRQEVLRSMERFGGLPHRLEYVGTVGGVRYYDDSISTIPEASIRAAESIPEVQTMLLGGMDRQFNYDILVDFIRKNRQIRFICAYAAGKRIFAEAGDCTNCCYVEDLTQEVAMAKRVTEQGRACILSPAAAYYCYFKNFEERGEAFVQYLLENS